jgi:hypothetical protein
VRDRRRVIGVGLAAHIPEAQPVKPPDDPLAGVRAKREGVAEEDPLKRNDAENDQALHQNGKNVFPPYEPAVEECQTGQGHEKNKCRRY